MTPGPGPDGARPDAHGRGERRRLPGPGRPRLDRCDGPGRRRALRGAAASAPGRLHPAPAPRPAPPRDLRDHRTIRTPPHRHEHRHQPPHRHHSHSPCHGRRRGSPPLAPLEGSRAAGTAAGLGRGFRCPDDEARAIGCWAPRPAQPPVTAALEASGADGHARVSSGQPPAGTAFGWGSAAGTASNDVAAGGAAGGVSACDSRPAVVDGCGRPGRPRVRGSPPFGGSRRPGGSSRRRIMPSRWMIPGPGAWICGPGRNGCSTAWSVPARLALATGGLPAAGGLRPQVMVTIDYRDLLTRLGTHPAERPARPGGRRPGPAPRPQHRAPAADGGAGADGVAAVHRARHGLDRAEDRLRRGHHPRPARRPGTDPGHRPGLPALPAPPPQGPHRPRPGLRLPRLHHPRALVRSPPHHLLVPRRNLRNGKRRPCSAPITTT